MLSLLLLACVVGVGLLMIAAMLIAGVQGLRGSLDARRRARMLAERVTQAKRMSAERAARQAAATSATFTAQVSPALRPAAPVPLPPIQMATGSTTFPQLPASRAAAGTTPPPASASIPAQRAMPAAPPHRAHVVAREALKRRA